MRCTVTKLARECVGLCPLSWFVREGNRGYYIAARRYEISLRVLKKYFTRSSYHTGNLVNRIIKITHAHNLHIKMLDFALFTIYT